MYPSLQTILTARPPTSTSTSTITSGTVSYSHNPAYREELEEVEGTEEVHLIGVSYVHFPCGHVIDCCLLFFSPADALNPARPAVTSAPSSRAAATPATKPAV